MSKLFIRILIKVIKLTLILVCFITLALGSFLKLIHWNYVIEEAEILSKDTEFRAPILTICPLQGRFFKCKFIIELIFHFLKKFQDLSLINLTLKNM